MESTNAEALATSQVAGIEPPTVTELGKITALTLGNSSDDTADMKRYYY